MIDKRRKLFDDHTEAERAAAGLPARPGFVRPQRFYSNSGDRGPALVDGMDERADYVPLNEDLIPLDQDRTDRLIEIELHAVCSPEEHAELLGVLPPFNRQIEIVVGGRTRADQCGGLHSDPMVRVIAAHAFGRRDIDFRSSIVAEDNAKALTEELERRHAWQTDRRLNRDMTNTPREIPQGLFPVAPKVSLKQDDAISRLENVSQAMAIDHPTWPPSNWPYIYRDLLRDIEIVEIRQGDPVFKSPITVIRRKRRL